MEINAHPYLQSELEQQVELSIASAERTVRDLRGRYREGCADLLEKVTVLEQQILDATKELQRLEARRLCSSKSRNLICRELAWSVAKRILSDEWLGKTDDARLANLHADCIQVIDNYIADAPHDAVTHHFVSACRSLKDVLHRPRDEVLRGIARIRKDLQLLVAEVDLFAFHDR
jgi:hypothetical protein